MAVAEQGIDWNVQDVLVGVLHTQNQLDVNCAHKFYHIPARLLGCPPEDIKVVALYQSRRLFGQQDAGVQLYGEVTSCRQVPRGDITYIPTRHPGELYYLFQVDRWQIRSPKIRSGGAAPGVYLLTNRFLLEYSRYLPELYLASQQQLDLYTALRHASLRSRRLGGSQPLPVRSGGNRAMISGWIIGVYTQDGRYETCDLRQFYHKPYSFLSRMAGLLGWGTL